VKATEAAAEERSAARVKVWARPSPAIDSANGSLVLPDRFSVAIRNNVSEKGDNAGKKAFGRNSRSDARADHLSFESKKSESGSRRSQQHPNVFRYQAENAKAADGSRPLIWTFPHRDQE